MKKNSLAILIGLLLTIPVLAQEPLEIKPVGELLGNYNYSLQHPLIQNAQVLMNPERYLILDSGLQNSFNILHASMGVEAKIMEMLKARVTYSILENNFFGGPLLNEADFDNFGKFLQERRLGGLPHWYRTNRLEDAYLEVRDERVNGGITIGQHEVPIRPWRFPSILPPLAVQPRLSPLLEWINVNLPEAGIYQNSTLTRRRDIGVTLQGDYQYFFFATGLYNGTGQAFLDNNNYKDMMFNLGIQDPRYGLLGVYHLRGRNLDTHDWSAKERQLQEVEKARYGVYLQIGEWEQLAMRGEFILTDDRWADQTQVTQKAGYVYLTYLPIPGTRIFASYDAFRDDNPLRGTSRSMSYFTHGFSLGIQQQVAPYMFLQTEYRYYWEFADGDNSHRAQTQFGDWLNQVNLVF